MYIVLQRYLIYNLKPKPVQTLHCNVSAINYTPQRTALSIQFYKKPYLPYTEHKKIKFNCLNNFNTFVKQNKKRPQAEAQSRNDVFTTDNLLIVSCFKLY